LPNDGLVNNELVVGGALLIPAGPRTLEPPPLDAVDAAIGVDSTDVGLAVVVMLGDIGPVVVPPGAVPESPLVPAEGSIEPPSAPVVVLPIVPLEFIVEVPENVPPLRDVDVFRLVPDSEVGELLLVEGTVDVTGGLVEVGLDNTPGVETQGRGNIVWFIGFVVGTFVVGTLGFVPVAPAGFGI
jgi:hypothetical protein